MYVLSRPRSRVAGYVDRDLGEGRQSDAKARGEAKSVRPKLDFRDVARVGAFHKRSEESRRRGWGWRSVRPKGNRATLTAAVALLVRRINPEQVPISVAYPFFGGHPFASLRIISL
jgi:hypothetical protein